jgi:hypothetical protein
MALITTGLTNGGVTAHYQFQYDDFSPLRSTREARSPREPTP